MDIYARPATAFVASFIGAPTINFLAGDLLADGGPFAKVRIADSAVVETRVPANACPSGRIELGLRPDAVRVVEKGQGDADAVVDVVERLGDRTYVYARAFGGAKVVRKPPSKAGSSLATPLD
jgi:multiple sugar transport system ATP-binding protein